MDVFNVFRNIQKNKQMEEKLICQENLKNNNNGVNNRLFFVPKVPKERYWMDWMVLWYSKRVCNNTIIIDIIQQIADALEKVCN